MATVEFYKRIAVVGEHIPFGKVTTYGQLALLCGKPNHSRQVGYALNHNKMGDQFPAYKVVNSQGYLSGAASFSQPGMQQEMLRAEGIEVTDDRVSLKKYGWKPSLEEAERFYNLFRNQRGDTKDD